MMPRRQISAEKVAEIQRLWYEVGTARGVARRAHVADDTAMRYKPADVPRTRRTDYGSTLHRRIHELWYQLRDAQAVADTLRIAVSTAMVHRPEEFKSSIIPTATGYKTWSESSRERWDRYWAQPTETERLQTLLGWNEE